MLMLLNFAMFIAIIGALSFWVCLCSAILILIFKFGIKNQKATKITKYIAIISGIIYLVVAMLVFMGSL